MRRSGLPASGANVVCDRRGAHECRSARADDRGVVVFDRLLAGMYVLSVTEPGFMPVRIERSLADGERAELVLVEPAPVPYTTARVVLDDGFVAKFAAIEVRLPGSASYVALDDDGVQTFGLWTNAAGRCVLPNLPEGEAAISATYGSRTVDAKVTAGGTILFALPAAPAK